MPGVFAPALVAVWLTARHDGRAAVDVLLARMFRWQVSTRWYLFAAGYFIAIKIVVAVAYRVLTHAWPPLGVDAWYLVLAGMVVSTPFQAGEEIGWRGYALPRLAERFGLGRASMLLGLIWAVWHLPFFFVAAADTYGQSLTVYTLQVTAISVAMAWLFTRTGGSLLLVMLMHSAINNSKGIVPADPPPPGSVLSLNASLISWLGLAVLWATAAYFLVLMRGSRPTVPNEGGSAGRTPAPAAAP